MSGHAAQRPQLAIPRGRRIVLVIPHAGADHARALSRTLAEVARLGCELVSIVDPADHLDALRLVLDGVADAVVATRPEHLPSLGLVGNLGRSGDTRPQEGDSTPTPDLPWRNQNHRRPKLIGPTRPDADRD